MSKYADEKFIEKLNTNETESQAIVNKIATQNLSESNFNNVFGQYNNLIGQVSTMDIANLQKLNAAFLNDFRYGAVDMLPYIGRDISSDPAKYGCKTAPEYATKSPLNMSRVDTNYHTYTTCKNKAVMNNKKYFSLVKPLPEAGVTNPNFYECHVGNDPLINPTDRPTSYYSYITCWSMGPKINTFGISSDTGDIIITADNIASLGVTQNTYSNTVTDYMYGGNNGQDIFLPVGKFVSMRTYIFDLKQVSIKSGFFGGGTVGPVNVPITLISVVPNTDDTYIVGARQGNHVKMVKIQLGIGNSKLYPELPNDGSLYAKAIDAKYTGLFRFVRITSACYGDNYLQMSELQIFDNNNRNIAPGKSVYSSGAFSSTTQPQNAITGVPEPTKKAYTNLFISQTNCNGWWYIDLGADTDITQIKYFNRQESRPERMNGGLLEVMDANKNVLFKAVMTGDAIQTFDIPPFNNDLNALWARGAQAQLVSDNQALGVGVIGFGIKGFQVRINPVALGRGQSGYSTQTNTNIPDNVGVYKTLDNMEPGSCQTVCDNDPLCLGYTTNGTKMIPNGKEIAPTDLGCYRDTWNRAMSTGNGNGTDKDSCLQRAKQRNHRYYGVQYYGECWTTNDESSNTGYLRYGADTRNCEINGRDWQNHVYRREFQTIPVTKCNFYSNDISSTSRRPQAGDNVISRNQTTAPVNNTTLNLTNNAIKLDLSQCLSTPCTFRLELDNNGNLKLLKGTSSNGTVSSSLNGVSVWNLFEHDKTVETKIKNIAPVTQLEWKNSGAANYLLAGEVLPSKEKPFLISPNGQFKLEIYNGYLQLKVAVYGCFATHPNYFSLPLYTKATTNEPQPYYLYQSDLSHPKVGSMYYTVTGSNGVAAKQINRASNTLLNNNNSYFTLHGYKPADDFNPVAAGNGTVEGCKNACNVDPNCKYAYYSTTDNKCYLGNKVQPAYVPDPDFYASGTNNAPDNAHPDTSNKPQYILHLRKQSLNVPRDLENGNVDPAVKNMSVYEYKNFKPNFFGPPIDTQKEGFQQNNQQTINITDKNSVSYAYYSTPISKAIDKASREIIGLDISSNVPLPSDAQRVRDYPPNPYAAPMPIDQQNRQNQTLGQNLTTGAASILQGFRNIEGFDTHGWYDPGSKCGTSDSKNTCYAGIKYGQLLPLQQIANDYSNRLQQINKMYYDLSSNIGNYNLMYNTLDNDPKYDFSGNQKIEFSGNTDLLTEMKNDSKKIALQTNNLYIAGSILTTTLLVSAIYLGRS